MRIQSVINIYIPNVNNSEDDAHKQFQQTLALLQPKTNQL